MTGGPACVYCGSRSLRARFGQGLGEDVHRGTAPAPTVPARSDRTTRLLVPVVAGIGDATRPRALAERLCSPERAFGSGAGASLRTDVIAGPESAA